VSVKKRTNKSMLMLQFWQNSIINTSLLIEHSLVCGAENARMKETKKEFVESSELVYENLCSYTTTDGCQVPQMR